MALCNQDSLVSIDSFSKSNLHAVHVNFTHPLTFAKMSEIDFNTSAEMAWQHSLQLSINGDGNLWDLNVGQDVVPKSHQQSNNELSQLTSMGLNSNQGSHNNGFSYKAEQIGIDRSSWNNFPNSYSNNVNSSLRGHWSPPFNVNGQNGNVNEHGNRMHNSNISEGEASVDADGSGQSGNGSNSSPIPIAERSQTEPLWQRRLNAKNRELEQLHLRMSAPELPTLKLSSAPYLKGAEEDPSSSFEVNGDHDFTHASPHTMRMLNFDMNMICGDQGTGNGKILPDTSVQNNSMSNGFVGYSSVDKQEFVGDYGYGQNVSYVDTFNGNMLPHLSADMHTMHIKQQSVNGVSAAHKDQAHSPRLYGQAILINGTKTRRVRGLSNASMQLAVQDLAAASTNQHLSTSPKSATSVHSNGNNHGTTKGMISKVIVPPAPGTMSDAVDVRTGEAGHMRHMCPHAGCDKHFSTSGHARRHSRIHDCLKPFECPHPGCQATFTRRDNCTQHQRARHKFQLVAHRIGGDE